MPEPVNSDERAIAKRAVQMLQAALAPGVSSFKDHIRTGSATDNDKTRPPLKDYKVIARTKKGNIPNSDGQLQKWYLNSLVLKIGKHGFIQNYGAETLRASNTVQRLQPQATEYERKYNQYDLDSTEFIDKAIKSSGVVEYLAKEIGEIRGYEVLRSMLQRMAENVNKSGSSRRPKTGGYSDKNFEW